MAYEVIVPRLGWNMDEGVFVEWLKQEGEQVNAGDMLFSLEGEKSIQEIESFDSGILRISPSGPDEGDTVAVGTVLAYLCEADEEPSFDQSPENASNKEAEANGNGTSSQATAAVKPSRRRDGSKTISPRALRVANELSVDWNLIDGTGSSGRIRERDVRAAAESGGAAIAVAASAQAASLSTTRKTIADRMLFSQQNTAAVTLTAKADATNLVSLRQQFKSAQQPGATPTHTDVIVKLVASALQEHPAINSVWQGEELLTSPATNIGIAVDVDDGLLVPVLGNVAETGLRQLANKSASLITKAREHKLTAAEMQDGTFTVTNLGNFGIDAFTPIINYPQTAILGVGCIARVPAVVGSEIMPRDQLTLSLTFDHRAYDGAPAARFLQAVVQRIENPAAWLV